MATSAAERQRKSQAGKIARGVCRFCGGDRGGHPTTCERCHNRALEVRRARVATGRCRDCPSPRTGALYCAEHRRLYTLAMRAHRKRVWEEILNAPEDSE